MIATRENLNDITYIVTVTYKSGRKDTTILKNENREELKAELASLEMMLDNNPTIEDYTVE